MQRPYAYDRAYLEKQISAGHEVVVDGRSYTQVDDLPSQAALDAKLRHSGLDASCLDAVDPLEPHGEPANPTAAESAQTDGEAGDGTGTMPASSPGPVGTATPPVDPPGQQGSGPAVEDLLRQEFCGRPLTAYLGKTDAQINKLKGVTDADVLRIREALTAASTAATAAIL
jgi:hypothetical protein